PAPLAAINSRPITSFELRLGSSRPLDPSLQRPCPLAGTSTPAALRITLPLTAPRIWRVVALAGPYSPSPTPADPCRSAPLQLQWPGTVCAAGRVDIEREGRIPIDSSSQPLIPRVGSRESTSMRSIIIRSAITPSTRRWHLRNPAHNSAVWNHFETPGGSNRPECLQVTTSLRVCNVLGVGLRHLPPSASSQLTHTAQQAACTTGEP
ncbi:hypothetical protein K439DRAFT_1643394, partial [Ramaria rubella]